MGDAGIAAIVVAIFVLLMVEKRHRYRTAGIVSAIGVVVLGAVLFGLLFGGKGFIVVGIVAGLFALATYGPGTG